MRIKLEARIEVVVRAMRIQRAAEKVGSHDVQRVGDSLIFQMRFPNPDRAAIVRSLVCLGSQPTADYGDHITLGDLMYLIATIEHLLGLAPTPHGRDGYPPYEAGNIMPFFDRAEAEFAEEAERERIAKEDARRRYLEEAAAMSPEYAAHAKQALEFWGDELTMK